MLLLAEPMNNFRVPPGDLTVQLPFTVPAGNPNTTLYRQLLLIGIDLNRTPLDQLPILSTDQITQIASALGLTANPYFGAQPLAVDQDFKNPRATQFGGGFERELAPGFTASARLHLCEDRQPAAQPRPEPGRARGRGRPTRRSGRSSRHRAPMRRCNPVQVRESTAESEYTALTLGTRLRKAWAQFNVNYVLSKSMSDDDNERDSGGARSENTFDLTPEWGPARLDRRHQFNGYAIFFLPYNFDVSTGLPVPVRTADRRDDRPRRQQQPRRGRTVPSARQAFPSSATASATSRSRK